MNQSKNWKDYFKKFWKELVLIIPIFLALSWWMSKDLLPSDGSIQAPAFRLPSLTGESIQYAASMGKVSVLYFFAPWCSICHYSIENLNTLRDDIQAGKVDLFIIALDWQNTEEVQEFVNRHQLPVEVLLGTRKQREDFKISGYPTYYIVDAKGKLRSSSIGYSSTLGIKARLLKLALLDDDNDKSESNVSHEE